jgi:hypothetical protein
MPSAGNTYDNAKGESFMETLKCDHFYLNEYRTYEKVAECLLEFIDQVYNTGRLHSGWAICQQCNSRSSIPGSWPSLLSDIGSALRVHFKSDYQMGPRRIVKIIALTALSYTRSKRTVRRLGRCCRDYSLSRLRA